MTRLGPSWQRCARCKQGYYGYSYEVHDCEAFARFFEELVKRARTSPLEKATEVLAERRWRRDAPRTPWSMSPYRETYLEAARKDLEAVLPLLQPKIKLTV